jgi:hypothetical protein
MSHHGIHISHLEGQGTRHTRKRQVMISVSEVLPFIHKSLAVSGGRTMKLERKVTSAMCVVVLSSTLFPGGKLTQNI